MVLCRDGELTAQFSCLQDVVLNADSLDNLRPWLSRFANTVAHMLWSSVPSGPV